MKRSTAIFVVFVLFLVGGLVVALTVAGSSAAHYQSGSGMAALPFSDRVGVIEINGLILDGRAVIETLREYQQDRAIKAIVVRLDTPGGAVAPSQEIYQAVLRIREEGRKPVVASMGSVAASGGYYIAAAADRVLANRGSVTGSIGVIMNWTNYGGLLEWARLQPVRIKAGELKDAGDPTRQLTDAERAYFQGMVDELHRQFIDDVARGRGDRLPSDQLETVTDGRVVTGDEAVELGLIDEIGGFQDAVQRAAEMAEIDGDPILVWPREPRRGIFDLLTSRFFGSAPAATPVLGPGRGLRFYYVW